MKKRPNQTSPRNLVKVKMKKGNKEEVHSSKIINKNKFTACFPLNELEQNDTDKDDESFQQSKMSDNQPNQANSNRPHGKPPPIVVYADAQEQLEIKNFIIDKVTDLFTYKRSPKDLIIRGEFFKVIQ